MLTCLRAEGQVDDEVRAQLAGGATPGTLLHGLFQKGRTADELLARLPADAEARLEAKIASTDKRDPNRSSNAASSTTKQRHRTLGQRREPPKGATVGLTLMMLGLVPVLLGFEIPALLLWMMAHPMIVLAVSAVFGAAGAFVMSQERPNRWIWAVLGLFTAPAGIAAASFYSRWVLTETDRESLLTLELVAAYLVGMLPALTLMGMLRVRRR